MNFPFFVTGTSRGMWYTGGEESEKGGVCMAQEQTGRRSAEIAGEIFSSEAAHVTREKKYLTRQGKMMALLVLAALILTALATLVTSSLTSSEEHLQQTTTVTSAAQSDSAVGG